VYLAAKAEVGVSRKSPRGGHAVAGTTDRQRGAPGENLARRPSRLAGADPARKTWRTFGEPWFRPSERGKVGSSPRSGLGPWLAMPGPAPPGRPGGHGRAGEVADDPCGPGERGPGLLLGARDAAAGDVHRRGDRGAIGVPRFLCNTRGRGTRAAAAPAAAGHRARTASGVAAPAATAVGRERGRHGALVRC